jgi:hypothetical protein
MFSVFGVLFRPAIVFLLLAVVFPNPLLAAPKGLGGSLGYTCKSTIEGTRQCECAGSEMSIDCQRMREEVCLDQHIDACITNADGTPDICACQWKVRKVPSRGGIEGTTKIKPLMKQ